jgi:ABC-type multidrug transport system fused ATPase/permease subunit
VHHQGERRRLPLPAQQLTPSREVSNSYLPWMVAARNLFEALAALATLVLIGWALLAVDKTAPIFWVTFGLMFAFFFACYLLPGPMTRLVSMPTAFRIDKNLGIEALELQSVTYASYHTNWFSNTTHAGFIVDGLAWYLLVWHFTGPVGVGLLLAWQVYQARSYRERVFTIGLVVTWVAIAAGAYLVIAQLGSVDAVDLAMFSLITMGLWRFVGHIAEPIPPDVAGNKKFARIQDVELSPRMVLTVVLGYVAEFAAGLPFRLLNFWVYSILVKAFNFKPQVTIDLGDIESQRDSIHEHGWSGARSTAHLAGD